MEKRISGLEAQTNQLEAQMKQMRLLNQMSQDINLALIEEDVFNIAADYASRIFEAARASVALLDPSGTKLAVFALAGKQGRIPKGQVLLELNTGVGEAVRTMHIIKTPDMRKSKFEDHKMLVKSAMLSSINAPLITGGKVIGSFNIGWQQVEAYSETDANLVLQLASILASNIHNRRLVSQLQRTLQDVQQEQAKSDRLLLNVLPEPIASRLKQGDTIIADKVEDACVLFADIVGFTKLSMELSPNDLIDFLNQVFSAFDHLAAKYGLEKIKTIGDAYMVVGGLNACEDCHVQAVASMAVEMQAVMQHSKIDALKDLQLRIGMHTGSVVAGVIGVSKFSYDVWGDTVNTASHMESHCMPGCIQVSEDVHAMLADTFNFEARGMIDIKGKGSMTTYFLKERKAKLPEATVA